MKRNMTALIIGNATYKGCNPLKNPIHDADDIASKLASYEFECRRFEQKVSEELIVPSVG